MEQIDIEASDQPAEDTLNAARSASKKRRRASGKPSLPSMGRWFAVRDAAGQPIATLALRGALGIAELDHLWVAEAARGKGIARRLVEAAEAEARAAKMAQLLVRAYEFENPGFFQHIGYRPIGTIPTGEDAVGISWLAKPLSEGAMAASAPAAPPAASALLPGSDSTPKPAAKTPTKFAKTRRRR